VAVVAPRHVHEHALFEIRELDEPVASEVIGPTINWLSASGLLLPPAWI